MERGAKSDLRKANKMRKRVHELFLLGGIVPSETAINDAIATGRVEMSQIAELIQQQNGGKEKEEKREDEEKKRDEREKEKDVNRRLRTARREKAPGPQLHLTLGKMNGAMIGNAEVRDLLHYSLIGPAVSKPRWCTIRQGRQTSQTVMVRVECPPDCINNNPAGLPFIDDFFNREYIRMDDEVSLRLSFWRHMFNVPVPMNEQIRERVQKLASSTTPLGDLKLQMLVTAGQMADFGYPWPIGEGIVPTKDKYAEVSASSPLFALDCEMCITTANQHELTRISVIREDGSVVFDTLVKPKNRITDYLTKFSGVTEQMMREVTTTIEDVQCSLRRLLPADAILIGHSCEFDLRAMKMAHPYCIDVGLIYNLSGMERHRTSLKNLCSLFLDEDIQTGRGHCSVEDSWAAMRLVKMKMQEGLVFGNCMFGWEYDAFMKRIREEEREREKVPEKRVRVEKEEEEREEKEELEEEERQVEVNEKEEKGKEHNETKSLARRNGEKIVCACGGVIGMRCIIKKCQCQAQPPSRCMMCEAKHAEATRTQETLTFSWSDAIRSEVSEKTRPLAFYLNETKKKVVLAGDSIESENVNEPEQSRSFTRHLSSSYPTRQELLDACRMEMLDYGLAMIDMRYDPSPSMDTASLAASIDADVCSLVSSAAKNAMIVVVMSSERISICYAKVKG